MHFSRSDNQVGGTNLSRINSLYISDSCEQRGGTIEILTGTCMLVAYDGKWLTMLSMCIPKSIQVDDKLGGSIGQREPSYTRPEALSTADM